MDLDFNAIIVYLQYFLKILQQIFDGFLGMAKPDDSPKHAELED